MIDTLAREMTFTADELGALALRVAGFDSPSVLGLRHRHTTVANRDAAISAAAESLRRRGMMVDGLVEPEVEAVLTAVQRPDRELALRSVSRAGVGRASVLRRGGLCVATRRTGDHVVLRILGANLPLPEAISVLLGQLPPSRPADVEPVGAPLSEMSEALSETHDPLLLADRIRTLGASQRAAVLLGAALGARHAFAEIVYAAVVAGEDRIERGPAAVAAFYTGRGRVIAAPSRSPAGVLWTTLKPGSDQVFGQALTQLVELSSERWEPNSDV